MGRLQLYAGRMFRQGIDASGRQENHDRQALFFVHTSTAAPTIASSHGLWGRVRESNVSRGWEIRIVVDVRAAHAGLSGIGRYAANLLISLHRRHPDIKVLGLATPASMDYLAPHTDAPLLNGGIDEPNLALPDLLRDLGADVYHTPLFVLPPIRSCRCICTIHDAIPAVRPDLCPAEFAGFFKRQAASAARAADHVVTVSESSRRDLVRELGIDPGRISVVYEPVSPIFAPRAPEGVDRLGLRPGYILSVGALDRRKNLTGLFRACARLGGPPLVVVGGGSGDGFDAAAEAVRLGLADRVQFLGRVDDETLATLYSGAGVFVFPSFYEGFGLPVVEAMACGAPVVASNTSSIPEVAGDAALLVDPHDPEAIAGAIAAVLSTPTLRQTMIRKGFERARRFTTDAQAEGLLRIYRRLVARAA